VLLKRGRDYGKKRKREGGGRREEEEGGKYQGRRQLDVIHHAEVWIIFALNRICGCQY
jgi:hypothetical protein